MVESSSATWAWLPGWRRRSLGVFGGGVAGPSVVFEAPYKQGISEEAGICVRFVITATEIKSMTKAGESYCKRSLSCKGAYVATAIAVVLLSARVFAGLSFIPDLTFK